MAIKVGGVEVVDNNRQLKNINSVDSGSVNVLNTALNTDPTRGTLTKTFANGETANITLNQNVSTAPVVSVTKEVAQTGQSSKGAWDVNATASNYDLHNTAYATTLTPSSIPVSDISQATYASKQSQALGFNSPRGLWFKPDGTKFYVLDKTNAQLLAYSLSTAWDASTSSYSASYTFTVYIGTGSAVQPRNMWFNSDGTSLYVIHESGIGEFSLSTAWDITTTSYVTGSNFYVGNLIANARSFFWKPDGTKMFAVGTQNDTVYEWHFSTAFDFSTGNQSNAQATFSVTSQSSSPRDIHFNSDGTKFYITDETNEIYEYSCSTAYDITTASYSNNYLDVSSQDVNPRAIFFGDGNLYMVGDQSQRVNQYNFSSDGLVLGTGSFASTDVGKRIQGNGGDVILTSTAGAYTTTGGSAFTDSSTIASGSWTMHGLKSAGDADGLTIAGFTQAGSNFQTSPTLLSATSSSFSGTYVNTIIGTTISHDGLHLYNIAQSSGQNVHHFTLSTAFDLSTATYAGSWQTNIGNSNSDLEISSDGRYMYVCVNSSSTSSVQAFYLDVAYYPESGVTLMGTHNFSSGLSANTPSDAGKITFSPDGTKMYHMPYTYANNGSGASAVAHTAPSGTWTQVGTVQQYTLGTAWNIWSGNVTYNHSVLVPWKGDSYASFAVTSDGKWLISGTYNNPDIFYYPLTTPFDISTQVVSLEGFIDMQQYMSSGQSNHGMIAMQHRDGNLYSVSYSQQVNNAHDLGTENLFSVPTSQYHLALTNTVGQIDSSIWLDINSMTADQSLGDGEAYYAVSTDDRTTWSVAKGSDGVRPIVRDNAGTWQYNSDAGSVTGYSISSASYDNKSFTPSPAINSLSVAFKPDGTKMFTLDLTNKVVARYSLSTAWDVSTATADSNTFSVSGQANSDPYEIAFKSDGTKLFVLDAGLDTIYQYSLTTAWDLSTASYDSVSFAFTSQTSQPYGFVFSGDGTKLYMANYANKYINQYSLGTAWDLTTISYDSKYLDLNSEFSTNTLYGITINGDGTRVYAATYSEGYIYQYNLSTAYDISTATYSNIFLDVSGQVAPTSMFFKPDGHKLYTTGFVTDTIYQYSTTETGFGTNTTWTNATTNDEFYALQQALGATSVNRMDKTQLDAVADGSHFTLGDTLDLMIALKQDTASASLPTSDGVTINYDSESLNQGAVLGTDYDFDFPASNQVRITSNAAQNLKIRVV